MAKDKEVRIEFTDEDGKLKSKKQFLEELSEVYDELEEAAGGSDEEITFMDLFASPETDFDTKLVLEKYQFVDRKLYLDTEIVSDTGKAFIEKIQFWNAEDNFNQTPVEERIPIQIYIDSPGGDLTTTMAIVDAIKTSKTPVYTIVTGTAYSGGFFIGIAGHKRFGFKNSTYLFHEGSGAFAGDAHKLCQQSAFYKNILLKQIKDHVLESTKITEQTYDKHYKDDWYFDAAKALKFDVIQEICTDVNGGIYNED